MRVGQHDGSLGCPVEFNSRQWLLTDASSVLVCIPGTMVPWFPRFPRCREDERDCPGWQWVSSPCPQTPCPAIATVHKPHQPGRRWLNTMQEGHYGHRLRGLRQQATGKWQTNMFNFFFLTRENNVIVQVWKPWQQ